MRRFLLLEMLYYDYCQLTLLTVHGGGSLLLRDVPMEIVHQISSSILTGLQTDITALPSSSIGAVDRSAVADLITRAI